MGKGRRDGVSGAMVDTAPGRGHLPLSEGAGGRPACLPGPVPPDHTEALPGGLARRDLGEVPTVCHLPPTSCHAHGLFYGPVRY